MKNVRTLACLAAGLFAGVAGAIVPQTPDYVCRRLNPDALKYQCLEAARDRYVDPYACGVIDRYQSSADTAYGMRIIAGGRYQIDALEACDRYTQSGSTNRCLWATRDAVFDLSALRACDRIQDADETTRCFHAIANCSLSGAQIAECDATSTAEGTTACFRYYCRP